MRGSSASSVLDSYLADVRRALACLTPAFIRGQAFGGVGRPHALIVNRGNPLYLPGAVGPVFFRIRQQYAFRQLHGPARERWELTTTEYSYTLFRAREGTAFDRDLDPRIVAWHFHSDGSDGQSRHRSPTHLHVYEALTRQQPFYDSHMPTGLVPLEAVIAYLLTDVGVPARDPNWPRILAETRNVATPLT
ncbi:MAG: hypothetical protein ACYDCQ_18060 [Dehalococcoidia bacterium]